MDAPKDGREIAVEADETTALDRATSYVQGKGGVVVVGPGGVPIQEVARLHSTSVWLLVGLTLLVLVRARRLGAERLVRATGVLLAIEVVQGAVGYWQYLTGVPAELVLLHMALATLFWVAAVRVGLLTGDRVRSPQPVA